MNSILTKAGCCTAAAIFLSVVAAQGALVVIDDFEINEGRFTSNPNTGSGTSQGFNKTAPATTADRVTTEFYDGLASQQITITDDPNVPGSPSGLDSWRLRHLSGGGSPANNLTLTIPVGETSFVGYWLKTFSAGLEAGIAIDDGAALEIARWQPIIPDGEWHFYEWQFQNADDWDAFAGTGPNGTIDNSSVTIDALFLRGGVGFATGTSFDATFFVDRVSYNDTGSIVPEPATAWLLGLAGTALAGRRRRFV